MRRSWKEQGQLRSPGFRGGGGGRFVNNWVWFLWHDPSGCALNGPGKIEYIIGRYPPPDGTGTYRLIGETRAYIGKGTPGGVSEGFEWTARELILVAEPLMTCHGEVEMPILGLPAGNVINYMIPLVIFIYPILDPWLMPSPGVALSSEPRTTFHDNALIMPSGFLDPATGMVGTNAMAQHSAGELTGSTPYASSFVTDPHADVTSWLTTFAMGFNPHAGATIFNPFNRPGWANPSGIPNGPFSRASHIEISNPPSGTIYGVGLFAFTLYDYHQWTSDTANIYLLSRSTIPGYALAVQSMHWDLSLAPYHLPQSLTWETHIWESDDTGLTDAQLMALRSAGVYEQNEKALLLV